MAKTIRIFQAIFLLFFITVIWTNRATFFSPFDANYWKDKYEHSQWNLPLSVRTIGDDGLYLYEGYRLIHGGDPTLLNAEVPPLGKYLIGLSITLFHNGYLYGFIVNTIILVLLYYLVNKITDNPLVAWGVTLLLATDPLFTAQYAITMLDNLQALWLLVFLAFLLSHSKNKMLMAFLAGIALGFFSETKFPILLVAILPLGMVYLWKTQKNVRLLGLFLAGIIGGYLLPYLPYFFMGHDPIAWLKVQKWIISFYRHSGLTPTWGSALANIFFDIYQNIFSRSWLPSPQWSPVWTLAIGLPFAACCLKKRPILHHEALIFSLLIAVIALYSVIPFWTRYLVLLLPLWYLGMAMTLSRAPKKLTALLLGLTILVNLTFSLPGLFPTPESTAKLFIYNWENSFFQDMYEDTSALTKTAWSRTAFRVFGLTQVSLGEIETVHVTLPQIYWPHFSTTFTAPISARYTTRHLGEFTISSRLHLVKELGKWRVNWTWSDYLPNLSPTTHLVTTVLPAKRGSIIGSDKKPLAEDVPSVLVSITPNFVAKDREDAMFQILERIFEKKIQAVYMHQRTFGNTLPDLPVPIGVIPHTVTPKEQTLLLAFPGISLTPHIGRANYGSDFIDIGSVGNSLYFECCSLLYTTTNYDGISGAEKKKNEQLKGINGGSLTLRDNVGTVVQTFLHPVKKDGITVQP